MMVATRTKKTPQRWSEVQSPKFYRAGQVAIALFFRLWVQRWRFNGLENIPRSGSAFLVANHTSGFDPLILGAAVPFRMLVGPGKIELFNNPIFARLLRWIGIFPLRQGVTDAAAVRTMVDFYRHGRVIVVYPEGGRSDTEEMMPFTPDFARLVIKLRAPVIPAGIAGARELLPVHSWFPRFRQPITVVVGEPLDLSMFYGQSPTPELFEEATALLQSRVFELVGDARRERDILLGRR